jgi:starch synthase (maltosyl-transferring)
MIDSEFNDQRVTIERVAPEIDFGSYPIKRAVGESIVVEADIFTDGHDALYGLLLVRRNGDESWAELPMEFISNDRWRASFIPTEIGRYFYTVQAWIDRFGSWRRDLEKKLAARQLEPVDFLIGAQLVEEASRRSSRVDATKLREAAAALRAVKPGEDLSRAIDPDLARLVNRYPARHRRSRTGPLQRLVRNVSALVRDDAGQARHFQRLRTAPALYCFDGIRHSLPAADPSDRP